MSKPVELMDLKSSNHPLKNIFPSRPRSPARRLPVLRRWQTKLNTSNSHGTITSKLELEFASSRRHCGEDAAASGMPDVTACRNAVTVTGTPTRTVTALPGDPGGPGLAGLGSESAIDVNAARRFTELQHIGVPLARKRHLES